MSAQAANRLGPEHLSAQAAQLGYDRTVKPIGIVHFGLGAFTRAHQAWYTDRAMAGHGGDWMIAGVSLRSAEVSHQLNPQGGLYTLAEKSGAGVSRRVIGSVANVLLATDQYTRIATLLAAPDTHLASFTVTEKGYCRASDGSLDLDLAEGSFYPMIAAAFAQRQAAGIGGLTLLSCDNLADNGSRLRGLMCDYLAVRAPELVAWFVAECRCPSSMVDRIVPATTAEDRAENDAALGVRDEGLVVTEPFSQWVVEDAFAGPRPAWDQVGAQIVADVAPYETAKLRMLNGAHSALAYLGLRAGYRYVHEAVADPDLRALVLTLMREEAAPTITPAPGLKLAAYADALIRRFENPALNHRLIQIAMDGSQKIPQRWLATLAANQRAGRSSPALIAAIVCWLQHVRGDNVALWGPVDDPRAADFVAAWHRHGAAEIVDAVFADKGIVGSEWRPTRSESAAILSLLAHSRLCA